MSGGEQRSPGTRREIEVPAAAAGERLDKHLASALPDLSRSHLARLVSEGHVLLDGATAKASTRLRGGERISVEVPEPEDRGLVPQALDLSIVFEDEDLLVIDKPPGLVVHPGAGVKQGTLVHALLHHCGPGLLSVGGPGRPGIVHRLDKGTSGILVAAKTPEAYRTLSAQFAARTVAKTYLAIVLGAPRDAGRVEAPIGRSTQHRTRMAIVPGGRPALSEWRVIERFGRAAALVAISLHTGRTHQARVHAAHAGHPIAGDPTYGGGGEVAPWARGILGRFGRPALHAFRLELDHPRTGRRMAFEAPLPADMAALAEALRAGVTRSAPLR